MTELQPDYFERPLAESIPRSPRRWAASSSASATRSR
jgi:hypothetical protein